MTVRHDHAAGEAIDAAQAAIWEWHADTQTFTVRASSIGPLGALSGDWQIEDFVLELEGLSRARLLLRLTDPSTDPYVDEAVTFAAGWHGRFVGAFETPGFARGLFLAAYQHGEVEPEETIEAVFQPIMHARSGRLAGFEALARWRGLDGQIKAVDRLPAGARNFLSDWLSRTMLEQSAKAVAEWRAVHPDLFVQVNLNSLDLHREPLRETVKALRAQYDLPAGVLRLELTEQAALRDFDSGVAAVNELKAAGAGIVLDDFGSGHSSFAWLAGIEADGLKIDPSLIQMVGRPRVDEIVSAIVSLAHRLDMTVTAEGVETQDVLSALQATHMDYAQGYLFSRPMLAEDVPAFMQAARSD